MSEIKVSDKVITRASSLQEIEDARDQLKDDLKQAIQNRGVIIDEVSRLAIEIHKMEGTKKDLQYKLRKARDLVTLLRDDTNQLKDWYFAKKLI